MSLRSVYSLYDATCGERLTNAALYDFCGIFWLFPNEHKGEILLLIWMDLFHNRGITPEVADEHFKKNTLDDLIDKSYAVDPTPEYEIYVAENLRIGKTCPLRSSD